MIVVEKESEFIMMTQHDHATLSGDLARELPIAALDEQSKLDVLFAIYEHDRGWIDLDATPFWNDRDDIPYSFTNFPTVPKLSFYRKGIEEVTQANPYAGLLCSLHYQSFYIKDSSTAGKSFIEHEDDRQLVIKQQLPDQYLNEKELKYHLDLLQFHDNLSLYMCLNTPGISKENEHVWYKNGFVQTFPYLNNQVIHPQWVSSQKIVLDPFPYETTFEVFVPLKHVRKEAVREMGIAEAYKQASFQERHVQIGPVG